MWRDCRKWHPKTIQVCFSGMRAEGFTLKPPKTMQAESNGSNKREHAKGIHPGMIKLNKQINRLCLHYHHYQVHPVFRSSSWKRLHYEYDQSFNSLAELLWMNFKVSAILSGKAQRLLHGSISNSLTGTHTNTLTRRMQNEAAAQNNLPDRLRDTQTHRQKAETVLMWGFRGIVVTIHRLL